MDRRPVAVVLALVVALAVGPAPASAHTNHASIDSQVTADGTVLVESAFISTAGFVVVHAVDEAGEPGEPLAAQYVPRRSGFRTALSLQVDPAELAGDGAREVWVVVHQDANGNGEFDPGTDNALSFFGELAGERATVATGPAPAYVVAERFEPPVADGSVSVLAAALPEDGYLVVRSAVDGEPGPVVGHVALAAGEHADVTVPLDRPVAGSDGTARLYAQLYTDDGDGSFDPGSDSRVRAGDEPVDTRFTVRTTATGTRTASGTGTGTADGGAATTETAIVNTPTPTTATTTAPAADTGSTTGGQPGLTPLVAVAALVATGLLAARVARDR
jgi:hypothetical protein